jgi:hypothetical protein
MPIRRSTFARPLVAIAMVAASSLYAIAQQSPSPSRVRGTIEGGVTFEGLRRSGNRWREYGTLPDAA